MSKPGITEWEYVTKLGEKILEENLTDVMDVELWFTSSAIQSPAKSRDLFQMHARITWMDGTIQKVSQEVQEDEIRKMSKPIDMVRYLLVYLAQYIILSKLQERL